MRFLVTGSTTGTDRGAVQREFDRLPAVLAFHPGLDRPGCARGTRHLLDPRQGGVPALTFAT